ncbi:DUF7282 domain-containing protein [Halomarina litorea]|uniref:DUF7282 domain-containing protein n=1 Tax=Halomarina litorea TaxID=2961595 RepID=UPI0020C22F54|nr:hypothetical protein [Halomarina sp. BCD28]
MNTELRLGSLQLYSREAVGGTIGSKGAATNIPRKSTISDLLRFFPLRPRLWQVVVLLSLSILVVLGGGTPETAIQSELPSTNNTTESTATIVLSNQTISDDTLIIESVQLSDGGFVVVQGSRYVFDNVPNPIGVSSYLPSGTHQRVSIQLTADAITNRTAGRVAAIAHRDDGDEEFEHFENASADQPYLDSAGEPVADIASIQAAGIEAGTTQSRVQSPNSDTRRSSESASTTRIPTASTPSSDSSPLPENALGLALGAVLVVFVAISQR